MLFHLVGIYCAMRALQYSRSPQGAIAWGVSLILCPYVALPMYLIFGRSRFRGYAELRAQFKEAYASVEQKIVALSANPNLVKHNRVDEQHARTFECLADRGWTTGNKVTLLQTSDTTFETIFEVIQNATAYVLIQFYIIDDDSVGRRLQKVLLEASQRGVKCCVLYDEVGSTRITTSFIDELRNHGILVHSFDTTIGFVNLFQLNFRNHRKLVIADGKHAIIGGNNIGDDYLGKNPLYGSWRDLQMLISGPEVLFLQKIFISDWYWATRSVPEVTWESSFVPGGSELLTVPTAPLRGIASCTLFFLNAINSSKQRFWISTPYFVPNEAILEALKLASLRGVDVRIVIPFKVDHLVAWLASFYFIEELFSYDVKIYRFTDGFLHEKAFLVDNEYCSIGSSNLDNRSFALNFEVSVLCSDQKVCAELEARFLENFSRSIDVSAVRFHSLPILKQLGSYLARLFAPIL